RAGAEGVAHLGPVEGDAHRAVVHRAVEGDVLEAVALDGAPAGRVEDGRDHGDCTPAEGEGPRTLPVPRRAGCTCHREQAGGSGTATATAAGTKARACPSPFSATGARFPVCARTHAVPRLSAAAPRAPPPEQ